MAGASRGGRGDGVVGPGVASLDAAWRGDVGAMEAALAATPRLVTRATADREGALHCVAFGGSTEAAAVLLCADAEVDARDEYGKTPLHTAAFRGHADVATALLHAGAEVDACSKKRQTLLHCAAIFDRREVVEMLLRAKAAVDARDKKQWTPLHEAAYWGSAEVAKALLCANANVDARSNSGWTPLHMAMDHQHWGVVTVLVAWGANLSHVRRPGSVRVFVSGRAKRLQSALNETVPMTEQERVAAKDAWRAAVAAADAAVADRVEQSLGHLQAAYDGFVADPTTLTVGDLKAVLMAPRDRDVRWHLRAHHVLLSAASVGLFVGESPAETVDRRVDYFRHVYWGWLESWMLLRSYLAVETRQQAPCKKKTHRENAPELLVHL